MIFLTFTDGGDRVGAFHLPGSGGWILALQFGAPAAAFALECRLYLPKAGAPIIRHDFFH